METDVDWVLPATTRPDCVTVPSARPALPTEFMALLAAVCRDIMAPHRHPQPRLFLVERNGASPSRNEVCSALGPLLGEPEEETPLRRSSGLRPSAVQE